MKPKTMKVEVEIVVNADDETLCSSKCIGYWNECPHKTHRIIDRMPRCWQCRVAEVTDD